MFLIGIPYAGFALLILPIVARDRRIWFGTAVLLLGVAIYILLPGRMFAIYLYFGLTGVAIVVATLVSRRPAIGFASAGANWGSGIRNFERRTASGVLSAALAYSAVSAPSSTSSERAGTRSLP